MANVIKLPKILFTAIVLLFFCNVSYADQGFDIVAKTSSGLGYDYGFGLQYDADNRFDSFGYDFQVTITNESKLGGSGYRYDTQIVGRYFLDTGIFFEGGVDGGKYRTEFSNGTVWEKSGFTPIIGLGYYEDFELTLRYSFPDNTRNETSSIYFGAEMMCGEKYTCGFSFRRASFFQPGIGDLSGNSIMFEFGYRF